MKIFDGLRVKFGQYQLNKIGDIKRNRKVSNFHEAKEVAIIYKSQGEPFYILVKQYVKFLKGEYGVRRVMALSYTDEKVLPKYQSHRLEFDYFTREQLNWYGKPKGNTVDNFVVNDYDILIDFSEGDCLPLKYILAQSKARFKVGKYREGNEEAYDLMIHTGKKSSFENYIKQINHFLSAINNINGVQSV